MIDGDYSEFLDHLYYGDELWLKYKGVVYFIQGWYDEKKPLPWVMECDTLATDPLTRLFYTEESSSMLECAKKLLKQPLFDGKTLPEIEQDVKWVDDYLG